MNVAPRRAGDAAQTRSDAALAAMLGVQCFAIFVAAPFGALGYSALRVIADLLLLGFVFLVIFVAPDRATRTIAVITSIG